MSEFGSRPISIKGLDTIRFFCAFWVLISHYPPPSIAGAVDKASATGMLINGIYNNLFSGPAAVIVFFVISGLCIHLPQRSSLRIGDVSAYYTRRYVRIVLPMLAAMGLAQGVFGYRLTFFEQSILWSLYAELIYYTIYPFLLRIRKYAGSWNAMIIVSYLVAFGVAATNPMAGNYPSFGRELNWLLGLPCWLLGCKLAESVEVVRPSSTQCIWFWRLGIWFLSVVCSGLRFHSPIGYPWSLNLFAIAVAFWLLAEISFWQDRRAPVVFEWLGSWSYSLYLVHTLAIFVLSSAMINGITVQLDWGWVILFVLAFSFLFSFIVEFPSHNFARRLAAWIGSAERRRIA